MAEGATELLANSVLSAVLQGVSFALPEAWLKVHIGAPGADCTANPAAETRRFNLSSLFATDPTGGVITNDGVSDTMTSVAATELWSHWSIWDDETAGSAWMSGVLTGGSVTAGQDMQIGVGQLGIDMQIAS